ncbi:hypothetical protein GE21DRAFT_1276410 [Neurospora crassa]|nr:hypothetical protein GE21DRAFT_1276410 [Neurospora crassa]
MSKGFREFGELLGFMDLNKGIPLFSDTGAMLDPQLKQCPVYIKACFGSTLRHSKETGDDGERKFNNTSKSPLTLKGEVKYKRKRKREREREREREEEVKTSVQRFSFIQYFYIFDISFEYIPK